MRLVSVGGGPALVLVPGIQGRWEWMRPAVRALARHFRVVTYSLAGERASGFRLDPETDFDVHVDQLDCVFAAAGIERAVVCGVSFGGLIALRYAALRPERALRLVLASAPGPAWRGDHHLAHRSLVGATTAFVAGAPRRLWPEISAARRGLAAWTAAALYAASVARHPASPVRMARRVGCVRGHEFVRDAAEVHAPTLVITGDPALDRVVPVSDTRAYLGVIPRAVGVTLERTGHIGLVTRPEAFAALIRGFAAEDGGGS